MTVFLANMQAAWLFFGGCAILTWVLLKRSHRYFGRANRKRRSAPIERQTRPQGTWDGVQRDSMAQIERQKVELFEMSRDLNGQLNSKIIILEQLIADSQRQIEHMEQLLNQIEQSHTSESATSSVE